MNAIWPDLAVRVLLSSSLVMAQAILLNWLKVPFAAITFFSGLAAYSIIAGVLPVAAIIVLTGLVFGLMVKPLPKDKYLLLSLAALELIRSGVGASDRFGGQLGAQLTFGYIPAQQPFAALPFAVVLFVFVLAILLVLRYSEIGLTVDLVRLGRTDPIANTMTTEASITWLFLVVAIVIASVVGTVQGAYIGWIDPNVFRLEEAIGLLVASLVIGRRPVVGTLLAIAFFLFPDLFSIVSGYSRMSAAHVREIIWGAAMIVLATPGNTPSEEASHA
jgi:hypothetical protein